MSRRECGAGQAGPVSGNRPALGGVAGPPNLEDGGSRCESPAQNAMKINMPISRTDPFTEIQVIFNLKATNDVTPVRLQTNHELHFGEKYLVFGDCERGIISAYEEYRVVPLPATFSTNELRGKNLNEQVECLLSLRLFNLQNELAPLLEEEQRIAPVVSNSRLQWFDSARPVTLGEIHEATTQTKGDSIPWLEFGTNQLDWSGCEPGKSGYFYCSVQWRTLWEFASCTATNLV